MLYQNPRRLRQIEIKILTKLQKLIFFYKVPKEEAVLDKGVDRDPIYFGVLFEIRGVAQSS